MENQAKEFKKDPNEVGALWLKETNGTTFLSGKIDVTVDGGTRIVIFKTKSKSHDKQPDYRILKATKQGG